jgi:hypothetical protein
MSGRPWFGCIIVGLALLLVTGCQSTTGSAVVSSGQPRELRQLSEAADTAEPSSVRAQNSEATLDDSKLTDGLLVPSRHATTDSLFGRSTHRGYRSAGSGTLGKQYVEIGGSGIRFADEFSRSMIGTPPSLDATVNVPISETTDVFFGGELVDHSKESVVSGVSVESTFEGTQFGVGMNHRLSDNNSSVSPFFGGHIAYVSYQLEMNAVDDSHISFQEEEEYFSWGLGLGGELRLSDKTAVRLGLRAGNPFDDGLDDVNPRIRLESNVWLADDFFLNLGASYYLDKDVSFGAGAGFGF